MQRFAIKGRIQTPAGLRFEAVDNTNWMTVRMMRLPDEGSPLQLHHKWFDKLQSILPNLRHINICPIIELGKDDYGHYAAYFQIEGDALVDWLRFHGVMTQEDAVNVAEHTLAALGALSQVRLIHGDICPARLIVKRDTMMALNTIIIEPGLAMLLHPEEDEMPGSPLTGRDVTTTAPEVLLRKAIDIRSDLYSLGVTLFYCLTGELPFPGATPQEVANAHLQHTPVPLDQYRADLPQSLCDWVMQLINRDPQARPASVAEAQQSLLVATGRAVPSAIVTPVTKPVLQTRTVTAAVPYTPTTAKKPVVLKSAAPKKSGALIAIIAASIALIVLLIMLLKSEDQPASTKPTAVNTTAAETSNIAEENLGRYPIGRYVRIENRNGKILNFAECLVFSGTTNIARNGKATSSSVDYNGFPERGIDGNTAQARDQNSIVQTKGNEALAWWELDLLEEKVIENIIVWNRKEPIYTECNTRLDGFQVVILDGKRQEIYRSAPTKAPDSSITFDLRGLGKISASINSLQPNASSTSPTETSNTTDENLGRYPIGRYVRIESRTGKIMNFAECLVFSGTTNLARKGKASSSSVDYDGPPERGNDGNTSQTIAEKSIVHTKGNEVLAWWEVDLLGEHIIENVIVWNRKEANNSEANTRMNGFQVVILDAQRNEVYRSNPTKAPESSVTFDLRGLGKK